MWEDEETIMLNQAEISDLVWCSWLLLYEVLLLLQSCVIP